MFRCRGLMGVACAVLLFFVPGIVWADIGIPMLAVMWPLSALSIVPVVLLESVVVMRVLGVGWGKALSNMFGANLLSTIVGIPVGWLALVGVEVFLSSFAKDVAKWRVFPPEEVGDVIGIVVTSPWLEPISENEGWAIPFAASVLLVPFFFLSFWIEALYVSKDLFPQSLVRSRHAIFMANAASYAMLLLLCVGWLVGELVF